MTRKIDRLVRRFCKIRWWLWSLVIIKMTKNFEKRPAMRKIDFLQKIANFAAAFKPAHKGHHHFELALEPVVTV